MTSNITSYLQNVLGWTPMAAASEGGMQGTGYRRCADDEPVLSASPETYEALESFAQASRLVPPLKSGWDAVPDTKDVAPDEPAFADCDGCCGPSCGRCYAAELADDERKLARMRESMPYSDMLADAEALSDLPF